MKATITKALRLLITPKGLNLTKNATISVSVIIIEEVVNKSS